MFNSLFGDLFDFNGDGNTDFGEEMLGFAIMDDIIKDEGKDYKEIDEDTDDFDDWEF